MCVGYHAALIRCWLAKTRLGVIWPRKNLLAESFGHLQILYSIIIPNFELFLISLWVLFAGNLLLQKLELFQVQFP